MAQRLIVEIVGDTSSLERAFGRASGQASTFGTRMRGFGKAAAFAAGSAGVAGLTYALTAGIGELKQHALVAAQTAAVLKSTGGAAGITAKHVNALASEIMNYSGIDDEAVQATENLVLGFTNIRNEAGKGNDIFDRTVKLVTDYSVRTGKDASGAAVLFGKALNDLGKGKIPTTIRGVGALSEATRKEIAAHLKAGDVTGAQAILLKTLESRYQGAARAAGQTLPGQLDILKQKFNNAAGQGVALLAKELQSLAPIFSAAEEVIRTLIPVVAPIAKYLFDNIVTPFKVIADLIRGDWSAAWADLKKPVQDAIDAVTGLVGGVGDAITGFLTDATTAATNFGKGIYDGMVSGITGFGEWISGRVTAGVSALTNAVQTALTAATSFGASILSGLKAGILGFANWIISRVAAGVQALRDALTSAFTAASSFGGKILGGMKAGILGFADYVSGRASAAVQFVRDGAGKAYTAAKNFGAQIVKGIAEGLKALGQKLKDLITTPINAVIGKINGIKFHVPGLHFDTHIPGVGTVGFDGFDVDPIPGDIPKLDAGGLVTKTGLAIVHRGETYSGVGRGLNGPVTLNVTVHAATGDPAGLAKAIVRPMVRELQTYARQNSLPGLLGT